MLSIISSKGILVNKLSTFRLAIKFIELNLLTSFANDNNRELRTQSQIKVLIYERES